MTLREHVHLDNTRPNANWTGFHSHNRIEETEVVTWMQKTFLLYYYINVDIKYINFNFPGFYTIQTNRMHLF